MLSILDKTRDLFLERKELCEELSDNLQGGEDPTPEWEQYLTEDWLWKTYEKGEEHVGFPEKGYGFQSAQGYSKRPEVFEELHKWCKHTLPREFGQTQVH